MGCGIREADWGQIVLSLVVHVKDLCCYPKINGKLSGVFIREYDQICVLKKNHSGYSVVMDQRKSE